jgi:hypothetical protein
MEIVFKTGICELEPGWLLVKFEGPKPPPEERPGVLQRTLEDWRQKHGGRRIIRVDPIEHDGRLIGLMVWTFLPAPKPVSVHPDIKTPREHLEPLLDYAYKIYYRDTNGVENIVVTNRAGTAAVFRKDMIHIVPIEKAVDEPTKIKFGEWKRKSKNRYLTIRLRTPCHGRQKTQPENRGADGDTA